MIYVTGDTHGDSSRFKSKEIKRLRKGDYLIICGDFGFVWDGSKQEKRILDYLGKRKYHVLFIEGTHDNLDLINAYPEEEWNGGIIHRISKKLIHLKRGSVFTIENKKIFVFGGGESDDSDTRIPGISWWIDEMPAMEELEWAEQNLLAVGDEVDYIITHQSSLRIHSFLNMEQNKTNHLGAFFDRIAKGVKYKKWYFGSVHMDKSIPPNTMSLFKDVAKTE